MRSYYQLRAIEGFMTFWDRYERRFPERRGRGPGANSNVALSFFNNKIFLDLADAGTAWLFPVQEGRGVEYVPSNPLMAVVGQGRLPHLLRQPQPDRTGAEYFEYDTRNTT
jgi:hypothetical protein